MKQSAYFSFIADLRKRIISALIIFFIFFLAGFFNFRYLIGFFLKNFNPGDVLITITSPFQALSLAASVGLITAIPVSVPFLIANIITFLKPALTKQEKKLINSLLFISFFLFILGFGVGLFSIRTITKAVADFFPSHLIKNYWDIGEFISQTILTSALVGLIFQFPVLLALLIKVKIIKVGQLEKNRRYFIAGSFIFVALLPPTDIFSLLIMTAPVIILYEATIFSFKLKGVKHNVQ